VGTNAASYYLNRRPALFAGGLVMKMAPSNQLTFLENGIGLWQGYALYWDVVMFRTRLQESLEA